MKVLVLIALILWALMLGVQAGPNQSTAQPSITPLFTRVDESPAFYVECRNDTGRAVSSSADIWPWAPSRLRIDGRPFVESGGIIGPGLSVTIEPGGVWRGIIALRQSRDGFSAPVRFGANVRGGRIVPLTTGRHAIAVRCGEIWSADFAFFWEDESQRVP
jgi:hypothetical protein